MILPIWYSVDLSAPLHPIPLQQMLVTGDNKANRIGVRLFDHGQPYTPTGNCRGFILRRDGVTLPIMDGVISGNEMYIDLPEAAYAVQGAVVISIVNITSSSATTVFLGTGSVHRSQSSVVIDPDEAVIDDINGLIQAIEAAVATIPASYTDLQGAVASFYGASIFPVKAGDLVWHVDDNDEAKLYKSTQDIASSESWTAAHWEVAVIGDDVADLKSEIDSTNDTIDSFTTIGTQLFDKDHAETEHWLPANNTVSASANSTSVIIPVNPSASDNYITVHRDTISSRFTVATFTSKPVIGSIPVALTGGNSASSITVPCSASIKYIMVLVHNASYDTSITVATMLNGLMVQFGQSYTGYESYQRILNLADKSVDSDKLSDECIEYITGIVDANTEEEKDFIDANKTPDLVNSSVTLSWTSGSRYNVTNGELETQSGYSYTNKMDCEPGDRISIKNNKGQICYWKKDGAYLNYESTSQNSVITFAVPANVVKFAFNNSDSTLKASTITVRKSDTVMIEAEYTAPAKLIYDSDQFTNGQYVSTSSGKIDDASSVWYCLPFIPVESNHKYRTQTQTQLVYYDSSLTMLSAALPGGSADNTGVTVEMDFTTPATCKYISINSKSPHEQLYDLGPYDVSGYIVNPQKLHGKTIVCFGDSITGNYGFGDNYPSRIEEFTGAKTYNCGFGGCRMELVASTSDVAYTNPFSMCGIVDALEASKNGDSHAWDDMDANARTLSRMVYFRLQILKSIDWSKVDIITIAYGTNEGGYPQDDENNKYNKQTYAGATRYCIEKLLTLYPTLRIVLLTPIYRYYTSENQDSDTHVNPNYGNKLTDNVATLISVGHEYKIPAIDMYYTLGINIKNYTSYFGDEDEQSDGTHINSFGREQFGRRVAGELMRLM